MTDTQYEVPPTLKSNQRRFTVKALEARDGWVHHQNVEVTGETWDGELVTLFVSGAEAPAIGAQIVVTFEQESN